MTSTSTIGAPPQQAEARTVADVALRSPELVNEVWCRRVFRQTLQALELQHAMHLPHAPITPHTLGIAPNGDPVLIPSHDNPGEPGEAADVQALGAVIHYAITREEPPAGPLRGRALEGYSDSLVGAVDRCMAADPAERPQTIDELRNLLGIVALGPAAAAPSGQLQAHGYDRPYQPPEDALPARWKRRLLIGAAGVVLLASVAGLVALLHDTVNRDTVVLQLPPGEAPARSLDPHETVVPPPVQPPPAPASATTEEAAKPVAPPAARLPEPSPPRPKTTVQQQQQQQQPAAAPRTTAPAPQPAPPPPAAPAGQTTTYKLVVEPWGMVYVDGDERGVSPPLKRLTLPPGLHTIRIVNPNFQDHVVKVEAGKAATGRIAHDFNDE